MMLLQRLNAMKLHVCCQDSHKRQLFKKISPESAVRGKGYLLKVIFPGVILGIIPKCPFCLAAYFTIFTGIGLSAANAKYILWCAVILCLIAILYFLAPLISPMFKKQVERKLSDGGAKIRNLVA